MIGLPACEREKCLEILCELYPEADLYTLLYVKNQLSPVIERMNIKTSFIQKFPMASRYYRYYLPLFPTAIEQFDLKGYDLVVSTSHCVAKGVLPSPIPFISLTAYSNEIRMGYAF